MFDKNKEWQEKLKDIEEEVFQEIEKNKQKRELREEKVNNLYEQIRIKIEKINNFLLNYSIKITEPTKNVVNIEWKTKFDEFQISFMCFSAHNAKPLYYYNCFYVDEESDELDKAPDEYQEAESFESIMDKFFERFKKTIVANKFND